MAGLSLVGDEREKEGFIGFSKEGKGLIKFMWEIKYSLVGVSEITTLAPPCCYPQLHVHPLNASIKIRIVFHHYSQ